MMRSTDECVFEYLGTEDGIEHYHCRVHDADTIGTDWPCEGWDSGRGAYVDPLATSTPVPVPTTPVQDEAPDMGTYSLNQLTDRCDRCGAQAFVVTQHVDSELLWCAHHYRAHENKLVEKKVLDLRSTINREASVSANHI